MSINMMYQPRSANGVESGDCRGAVTTVVDYWNGSASTNTMRPPMPDALIRWAPKGSLDLRALVDDSTPASANRGLNFPVPILRGEDAPRSTHVIAEGLSELRPTSRLLVIDGAGHMGPLTHAPKVSALILRHIVDAAAGAQQRRSRPRSPAEILGAAERWAEVVS
jgi:pimeloyl-ACP methyl ester carboxylesterase